MTHHLLQRMQIPHQLLQHMQVFTGRPVLVTTAAAASCQAERVATASGQAMSTQP